MSDPLGHLEQVVLQGRPQRAVVPACAVVVLAHPVAAVVVANPVAVAVLQAALVWLLHRRPVVALEVQVEQLVVVLPLVQEPLALRLLAVVLLSWLGLYHALGIGPSQILVDPTSTQKQSSYQL